MKAGSKPIRLGTRGSDLARTQSGHVARLIESACGRPVEMIIIKTRGDRIQDVPLDNVEGKGFFTREIEEALLAGRIDVAVHSLKDLPVESPPGLTIAAIPPREDFRDLLLVREDVAEENMDLLLPQGATVGTGSRRRAIQIQDRRPDLKIEDLRGNVPTRIRKLQEGRYDAIVLASAGYNRLGIQPDGYRIVRLESSVMLPAPGQGALGVQTRADDEELREILTRIHNEETAEGVAAERELLALMGGGCGTPLAAWGRRENGAYRLSAAVGSDAWRPGEPTSLRRTETTGATPDEAARKAAAAFSDVRTDVRRERIRIMQFLMPVIENGAAESDDLFAGLAVECHTAPVLRIEPCGDPEQISSVRKRISEFDWILFSSANGAAQLFEAIDVPSEDGPRIACVGPGTAEIVEKHGLKVEFIPHQHSGDALAEEFAGRFADERFHILLPRPAKMGSRLQELLEKVGYDVEPLVLYTTEQIEKPQPPAIPLDEIDLIVFRSPSAVRAVIAAFGIPPDLTALAIGPTTAEALREYGHKKIIVASRANRDGLRDAAQAFIRKIQKQELQS